MTQTPFHSKSQTFFSPSFPLHIKVFTNTAGVGRVHDHDYHEAVLVLSGKGAHITATTQDPYQKGSLFLVPSGCIHHYRVDETGYIFNILFHPSLTTSIYPLWKSECPDHPAVDFFNPGATKPLSFSLSPRGFLAVRQVCEQAAYGCQHLVEPCARLILKGLFLQLVGHIFRHARPMGPSKIRKDPSKVSLEPLFLHLQKNFREPWTLNNLAATFQTNPSYLSRVFHERTGYTLPAYINALRLNESKRLLLGSGSSVLDIALKSGFENLSLFNRSFKRFFGVTPRAIRKKTPG